GGDLELTEGVVDAFLAGGVDAVGVMGTQGVKVGMRFEGEELGVGKWGVATAVIETEDGAGGWCEFFVIEGDLLLTGGARRRIVKGKNVVKITVGGGSEGRARMGVGVGGGGGRVVYSKSDSLMVVGG
ncbi:hypothetical protein TrCOL_g7395, partial [Triparma columacea]